MYVFVFPSSKHWPFSGATYMMGEPEVVHTTYLHRGSGGATMGASWLLTAGLGESVQSQRILCHGCLPWNLSGGHRHGISNDCRGSHTYEHITKSQSNEIRRNETHLNLGSGLGQGTIKNSRGSQFQDFLNTRGVRADKELACQLLSPFKKRWHQSYVPLRTCRARLRRFEGPKMG